MADPRVRLSVNFLGSPPLRGSEFQEYKASHPVDTVAGAALALTLPLGEYQDDKLLNLGANRFTTLRRIVFPLALPGMISSGLFAFLISFDELIIAIFISSPTITTLPKKLWDGIRTEINPTIAAISTMLITLSVMVLVIVALVRRHFENRSK